MKTSSLSWVGGILLLGCSCPQPPPSATPTMAPGQTDASIDGPHSPASRAEHGGHHHGAADHGAPKEGDDRAPLVHGFDGAEKWARRFESPERDAYQQPAKVIEALMLSPGMAVADVGTGTGYFLPYLAEAGGGEGRVLAVDISPDMIRWVRARAEREGLTRVEPRLALLDDPLLERGSLDRVLVVNTWHHIPERVAYARRLAAALRPGGMVVVVDFKLASEQGPPKEHKLAPSVVVDELTEAGLEVRLDEALLPEQYLAFGTKA